MLVVEDDARFARVLKAVLQGAFPSAILDVCETETEAIVRARMSAYDLLIVDLHLEAGGEGAEVVRHVRDRSKRPLVKVLIISGMVDEQHVRRIAERAGANDYLMKPFEMGAIVAKARELLAMPTEDVP